MDEGASFFEKEVPMNMDFPNFEAKPGTVIRVIGTPENRNSFCGYCRGLILEHDHVRMLGGFRRYSDRNRRVSWAEPVDWPVVPVSLIRLSIAPERPWMKLTSPPQTHPDTLV